MLSSDILRDIGALTRMVQTMSDLAFRQFGLNKGQFFFVTRICENPGITVIQLAQKLFVDKGTASKAVKKLSEAGFVVKRQDDDDNRVQRLIPTEYAVQTYKKLMEKEELFITRCFNGFSDPDIRTVTDMIHQLRENMEKLWREEQ